MGKNYYDLLNLDRNATTGEIKDYYKKLAKVFHPDINSDPKATEKFKNIQKAFEILSNPQKRTEYDKSLQDRESKGEGYKYTTKGREKDYEYTTKSPKSSKRKKEDSRGKGQRHKEKGGSKDLYSKLILIVKKYPKSFIFGSIAGIVLIVLFLYSVIDFDMIEFKSLNKECYNLCMEQDDKCRLTDEEVSSLKKQGYDFMNPRTLTISNGHEGICECSCVGEYGHMLHGRILAHMSGH